MVKLVRGDAGSATVEMAVALPAVVLVLSLLLTVVQLGTQRIRVERAAAVAARMASIDAAHGDIQAVVRRIAGPGASAEIGGDVQGWVTVSVSKPVVASWLSWTVSAEHVAPHERYVLGFDRFSPAGFAPPLIE